MSDEPDYVQSPEEHKAAGSEAPPWVGPTPTAEEPAAPAPAPAPAEEKEFWVYVGGESKEASLAEIQQLVDERGDDLPIMRKDATEWSKASAWGIKPKPKPVAEAPPAAPVPPAAPPGPAGPPSFQSPPAASQAPPAASPPPAVHTGGSDASSDGVPSWIQGTGIDGDMDDPLRSGGGGGGGGQSEGPRRFYLKSGSSAKIIFLSNANGPIPYGPPLIFEHNPSYGSGAMKWQHYHTCLQGPGRSCEMCEYAAANDNFGGRYKGMFFTIYDLTTWKDNSGKEHVNGKSLLVAKKQSTEILARKALARIEAGGDLRGAMYNVHRGASSTSSKIGDDFEFMQMVDLTTLPDSEPFDYAKVLAPNRDAMLQALQIIKAEKGQLAGAAPIPQAPVQY